MRIYPVLFVMAEGESRPAGDESPFLKNHQVGIKCDPAESDDAADTWEQIDFLGEPGSAGPKLFRRRFVLRRRAADRSRNIRILQREPIADVHAERLRGEAGFVESAVKEIARTIPGEH